eukprot:Rhum_TRINITY_DN14607_c2_g1::Rhum_TRINITY_DN14607_c2_g1_i1::g.103549::m.103549
MHGAHDPHRRCLQPPHAVTELSHTSCSHDGQATAPSLTARSATARRSAANCLGRTSQRASKGSDTSSASRCLHSASYSTTTRCAFSSSSLHVARMLFASSRMSAIFCVSSSFSSSYLAYRASSSARSTRILPANSSSTSSNAHLAAPTLPASFPASTSVRAQKSLLPRWLTASSCSVCSRRSRMRARHTSDTSDVVWPLCAPCDQHRAHAGTRHSSHQRSSGLFRCTSQHLVVHFALLFHGTSSCRCLAAMNTLCILPKHSTSSQKNSFPSGEHSSQRPTASFPHTEHRGCSMDDDGGNAPQ